MGQIFYASAYDIEDRTCCTIEADKFHANCFSFSGAVFSIHYLLRQKPYRVMWGGVNMSSKENIKRCLSTEDLLGLSTYLDDICFDAGDESPMKESCDEKTAFIRENNKLWKRINVWNEAEAYFDRERTHSVKYSGYLINHAEKQAVDLVNYWEQSKFMTQNGGIGAIDPVPVLTETGGGAQITFFDGVTINCTEELDGKWCGGLLQIVDTLPADYRLINCCFSEIWSSVDSCYHTIGVDAENFVLKDKNGERLKVAGLNFYGKRSAPCYVNVEEAGDNLNFKTVRIK